MQMGISRTPYQIASIYYFVFFLFKNKYEYEYMSIKICKNPFGCCFLM